MKQKTILIVDDEVRLINTTTKILERLGYAVLKATNGIQAVNIIRQHSVDVVIMDVDMPGISGLEALAKIKKSFPLIEVIMLTGTFSNGLAPKALKLGAYDLLLKPISISELVAATDDAYKKHQRMKLASQLKG